MDKLKNSELINNRRVINGIDDGLIQVAPLKYDFADKIFRTMLQNNWAPQEVSLQEDIEQWNRPEFLTEQKKHVFKRSLAFISNLDGIQTDNLTNKIVRHISSQKSQLLSQDRPLKRLSMFIIMRPFNS